MNYKKMTIKSNIFNKKKLKTFKTFHWTHYYIDIFQAATAAIKIKILLTKNKNRLKI